MKTVETHISSVLRTLRLPAQHELTNWASDRRLLRLRDPPERG